MMILNLSESLAKPLVMAKLNMAYLSSLNKRAKLLSSYLPVSLSSLNKRAKLLSSYLPVNLSLSSLNKRAKLLSSYLPLSSLNKRAKLLSSYLPVSPSRVLRAPGTSSYHLVPKHLRATWPRPEQSHLLPEACSPDGTDKRRQRQRRTERPPPEPSNILKRFCALYDVEIRYYKKKVSKLYCLFNRNPPSVPIWEHSIPAEITKLRGRITVKESYHSSTKGSTGEVLILYILICFYYVLNIC